METSEYGLVDRSEKSTPLNVRTRSTFINEQVTTYHYIHYKFDKHVITVLRMRQYPHVTTTLHLLVLYALYGRQQFILTISICLCHSRVGNLHRLILYQSSIPLTVQMDAPQSSLPFIPEYNKPDSPGVWMNFDNTVAIYMIITGEISFVEAAQQAFSMVRDAQARFPDWPRIFYLDVGRHSSTDQTFDDEMIEFQQEFWFSAIAPFLTSFDLPLTGPLVNPISQRNDIPDSLAIE